jgi:hypothetical protein
LVVLAPLTAGAQGFQIPRVEDGEGIKAGQRSTFHAGFALATGVDTNVFNETRTEGPRAAAYMYPTSWLGIGNRALRDGLLMTPAERSGRILDYNVSVIAGFRQYLARDVVVRSQPRFSIGTQIRLSLLPGRKFSVDLDEDFFRGADPGNYEANGRFFNFNRIDHRGALTFIGRPGGGRLSLAVGYKSQLLRFGNENLSTSNRMVHGLKHETKWRFLPRSSLVFNYDFDFTFYTDCCANIGQGRNEDNYAHRILGGYRGQGLKKFIFEGMVGWGFGYYRDDPNGPNFSSFLGHLSMNYYPTLRSLVHASVYRNFSDSLLGNYFVDNGVRVGVGHQFKWRMYGDLGLGVVARRYHGLPAPGEEDADVSGYEGRGAAQLQLRNTLVVLNASVEQPLGRLFSLALRYNLFVDSTDFRVSYTNGSVNDLGYVKHLVWLMAAVRI